MADRCGYAVTDNDGIEGPCDRPVTGWRWYQDVGEHEDMLDTACDWHANEGGMRMAEAEHRLLLVRAFATSCAEAIEPDGSQSFAPLREVAAELRAILNTPTHPAPTSTGAGTARDAQAAGGEGER